MHFVSSVGDVTKPEMRLRKQVVIPETRHHMYVKQVPFRLALATLGINPNRCGVAASRLIGVTSKTVGRALNGGVLNETFMANSIAAFRLNSDRLTAAGLEITFDEFFETRAEEELPQAAV